MDSFGKNRLLEEEWYARADAYWDFLRKEAGRDRLSLKFPSGVDTAADRATPRYREITLLGHQPSIDFLRGRQAMVLSLYDPEAGGMRMEAVSRVLNSPRVEQAEQRVDIYTPRMERLSRFPFSFTGGGSAVLAGDPGTPGGIAVMDFEAFVDRYAVETRRLPPGAAPAPRKSAMRLK